MTAFKSNLHYKVAAEWWYRKDIHVGSLTHSVMHSITVFVSGLGLTAVTGDGTKLPVGSLES